MDIADCLAHLQELFVLIDRELVLAEVVVQDSSRVVRPALVSGLSSALACKSQNVVVFQPFLSCDSVV